MLLIVTGFRFLIVNFRLIKFFIPFSSYSTSGRTSTISSSIQFLCKNRYANKQVLFEIQKMANPEILYGD